MIYSQFSKVSKDIEIIQLWIVDDEELEQSKLGYLISDSAHVDNKIIDFLLSISQLSVLHFFQLTWSLRRITSEHK